MADGEVRDVCVGGSGVPCRREETRIWLRSVPEHLDEKLHSPHSESQNGSRWNLEIYQMNKQTKENIDMEFTQSWVQKSEINISAFHQ